MRIIWFLIEVAVVMAAVQLVLAPFVGYFVTRQAAKPQFQSFDIQSPPLLLPPSYTQNIALMEELGFNVVAHLFREGQATSVRSVLALFVNQSEKDMAVAVHMLSEIPAITRLAVNYVEFSTYFEEGSEVRTINSKLPMGFVQVPEKKIFRLPHITEPKKLYALHRALSAQSQPTGNKRLPPAGEEVSDLVARMERDLASEASFGRLRLDDSGLWYRPTAKAAMLNSLKFGWLVGFPRRHILRWRGKRLAREILKDQ